LGRSAKRLYIYIYKHVTLEKTVDREGENKITMLVLYA